MPMKSSAVNGEDQRDRRRDAQAGGDVRAPRSGSVIALEPLEPARARTSARCRSPPGRRRGRRRSSGRAAARTRRRRRGRPRSSASCRASGRAAGSAPPTGSGAGTRSARGTRGRRVGSSRAGSRAGRRAASRCRARAPSPAPCCANAVQKSPVAELRTSSAIVVAHRGKLGLRDQPGAHDQLPQRQSAGYRHDRRSPRRCEAPPIVRIPNGHSQYVHYPLMAEIAPLDEAVAELVHDGDTVALEGFTHLIPFAAGHEIIRQGRRDLTLVRMTPDIVYDQMIGAGLRAQADLLVGRQPGRRLAAPLPRRGRERLAAPARARGAQPRRHGQPLRRRRLRAAVRRPARLRAAPTCAEHTADDRADHLPVHRRGADRRAGARPRRRDHPRPAGRPRTATCSCGASPACRRRPCWPPTRSLVTVEEIVDELEPRPGRGRAAVAGRSTRGRAVPGGAHPSYAHGYYDRDNAFYRAWDAISRDRDAFTPGWTTCRRRVPA